MTRVDALCLLSTGHLLRILIPLEEPPHLTADFTHTHHYVSYLYVLVALRFSQRTIILRLQLATILPCVAAPAAEDS